MENKISSLSSLINTYKAAVVFIDNGGTLESIPNKNKILHKLVEAELKRRLIIDIRYKIDKNRKFKHKIYKKLKVSTSKSLEPQKLYALLNRYSYSKLKNLKN